MGLETNKPTHPPHDLILFTSVSQYEDIKPSESVQNRVTKTEKVLRDKTYEEQPRALVLFCSAWRRAG